MAMKYLKVYYDWNRQMSALSDAEKGRLFTALIEYSATGSTENLSGREELLFPVFQSQIDRDKGTYQTAVDNGKRGGRPQKPDATRANLKKPKITGINQDKEEEEDKDKDKDKEEDKDVGVIGGGKPPRFTPPSLSDVKAYCAEIGNTVDAAKFVDYYASNGWKVGNHAMKDWRAAVRNWQRRDDGQRNGFKTSNPFLEMYEEAKANEPH